MGWQHIAMVAQELGGSFCFVTFYKDGVYSWPGSIMAVTGDMSGKPWVIGQDWDGESGSDYFHGAIDDVRIYNRTLDAQEVLQLYNMGFE